jgi:ubiquinol-cytochrome c reductase cytochrome b subunit
MRVLRSLATLVLGLAVSMPLFAEEEGNLQQAGTDIMETYIGRALTFFYFLFFITMPIWTKLDRTKPVPERVTTHD